MSHTPTVIEADLAAAEAEVEAVLTGAGVAAVEPTRWIAVSGPDRVRWLNGMVTNSVTALTADDGAYSFVLSAQGRIQADLTVWAEPERLLLETDAAQAESLKELLDRYIIMDDVELSDEASLSHGLLLAGPAAPQLLRERGWMTDEAREMTRWKTTAAGESITVLRAYGPAAPRYEIWTGSEPAAHAVRAALLESGAAAVSSAGLELLRIAEGTPRFGADIRTRDLPQETGQQRALHFSKGCYLGQEIVERIRSRGAVHRVFTRFRLQGAVPAAGMALLAEEKPAGELTSVAAAELNGERLALGYVRREVLDRGLPITYEGGSAEASPPPRAS